MAGMTSIPIDPYGNGDAVQRAKEQSLQQRDKPREFEKILTPDNIPTNDNINGLLLAEIEGIAGNYEWIRATVMQMQMSMNGIKGEFLKVQEQFSKIQDFLRATYPDAKL